MHQSGVLDGQYIKHVLVGHGHCVLSICIGRIHARCYNARQRLYKGLQGAKGRAQRGQVKEDDPRVYSIGHASGQAIDRIVAPPDAGLRKL